MKTLYLFVKPFKPDCFLEARSLQMFCSAVKWFENVPLLTVAYTTILK